MWIAKAGTTPSTRMRTMATRRLCRATTRSRRRWSGGFVAISTSPRRSRDNGLLAYGDRLAKDAAFVDAFERLLAIHFQHQREGFLQVFARFFERFALRVCARNLFDESDVATFFGGLINCGERLRHESKLNAYFHRMRRVAAPVLL